MLKFTCIINLWVIKCRGFIKCEAVLCENIDSAILVDPAIYETRTPSIKVFAWYGSTSQVESAYSKKWKPVIYASKSSA